jgi:hypothetical protein
VLKEKLPTEFAVERDLLGDLRNRAGRIHQTLDLVYDLVSPWNLSLTKIDLTALTMRLAEETSKRLARGAIHVEAAEIKVEGDLSRLTQLLETVLDFARTHGLGLLNVTLETSCDGVVWTMTATEGVIPAESLEGWPQLVSRSVSCETRLRLALAFRAAEMQGGRLALKNLETGGFRGTIVLGLSSKTCCGEVS